MIACLWQKGMSDVCQITIMEHHLWNAGMTWSGSYLAGHGSCASSSCQKWLVPHIS